MKLNLAIKKKPMAAIFFLFYLSKKSQFWGTHMYTHMYAHMYAQKQNIRKKVKRIQEWTVSMGDRGFQNYFTVLMPGDRDALWR
jgi:hypothetical protein